MPPPSNDELGDLMQCFYMQLLSADSSSSSPSASSTPPAVAGQRSNLAPLIQAINNLEDALLYADVTDEQLADPGYVCEAVALEIVQDCQRKGAAAIRAHFAEQVRGLIFVCRKQRARTGNKEAGGAGAGAGEHGQRHLNAMVELLGSWSNIVAGLLAYDVSDELLAQVTTPLHTRVSEAAFSCYEDFMEDKNIHQWHRKAAPPSSGSSSNDRTDGAGTQAGALPPQAPVSLSVLDYLLCQLVSMRAVVLQYQFFLAETCGLPALAEDATMHAWLELDASYSALEGLYLQSAASEALQQTATRLELLVRAERERENGQARGSVGRKRRLPWQQLLEIQAGQFSLQVVEDFFFVLQKVLERALQSHSESSIFGICSQLVELLSPADQALGEGGAAAGSYDTVHAILSGRRHFVGITGLLDENGSGNSEEAVEKDEGDVDMLAVTSAVGENIALTTLAFADSLTSGYAGSWLSALGSTTAPPAPSSGTDTPSSTPVAQSQAEGLGAQQLTAVGGDSLADLQQAFLSALELDSEGAETDGGDGAALSLAVVDQGVLLNSLATATLSIEALRDMVSGYLLPPGADVTAPHMPSLAIAVEELDRCWQIYDGLLEAEVNALERSHMLGAIDASIKKLLLVHPSRHGESDDVLSCSPDRGVYHMTGDKLDLLQKDAASAVNPLVECIRTLFVWTQEDAKEATGSTGTSRAPSSGSSDVVVASASRRGDGQGSEQEAMPRKEGLWRQHVSRAALVRVLLCVATTINDGIMHVILGTTVEAAVFHPTQEQAGSGRQGSPQEVGEGMRLNEWGALLLHDLVMQAIDEMETLAVAECDTSIRHCFLQLIWTMKLLTLDQPADLRRSRVPFQKVGLVSAGEGMEAAGAVKCILARRADFSREAILRMKIDVK